MQVNVLDQDGDDALHYLSKHSENLGLNIDMVYSTKGVAVKTINLE